MSFSRYTGPNKDITLGANDFYFFGFRGYMNDQMLNDIVVLDSDIENGILNKVYDRVKKQYTTLSITPSSYMTNNWPYTEGTIHEIHGNVLDNFNISGLAYNSDKIDNAVYKFYYVYVLDSLNNMNYSTGAKYVDSVTYYTQSPTIFYDENQYRVEAYGDGDITLYVDDVLVSNPYYFTRPEYDTEYNVVAFAQENGKEISDPTVYSVHIEGYRTADPVITYSKNY